MGKRSEIIYALLHQVAVLHILAYHPALAPLGSLPSPLPSTDCKVLAFYYKYLAAAEPLTDVVFGPEVHSLFLLT